MYIPSETMPLINSESIVINEGLGGIKFIDYENDSASRDNVLYKNYKFLNEADNYHEITGVLSLKGNTQSKVFNRLSFIATLPLKRFVNVIEYDPLNPQLNEGLDISMRVASAQIQSDFKGEKLKNSNDYYHYLLEGLNDERELNLPVINGWQAKEYFDHAVFISYHCSYENVFYGRLYLPKVPILPTDGQTQTAALFKLAHNKDAVSNGALDNISATIEIALNVDQASATQAFVDRNGQGSKKNKHLNKFKCIEQIKQKAISGSMFEGRVANASQVGSISVTSTKYITDITTMHKMLIIALTGSLTFEEDQIQTYHIDTLLPFAKKFVQMMNDCFSDYMPEKTANDDDPYRKKYVFAWACGLKAIAMAFFNAHKTQLQPIVNVLTNKQNNIEDEDTFLEYVNVALAENRETDQLEFNELVHRLKSINWLKHTKHWVYITGYAIDKNGEKTTWKLKSKKGDLVVKTLNQNTPVAISRIADVICSLKWHELTGTEEEPLSESN